jgi:hypothetical protein
MRVACIADIITSRRFRHLTQPGVIMRMFPRNSPRTVGQDPLRAGSPLRTPGAAAVAGIVFSVFLITALVLLRLSVPAHAGAPARG